MAGMSLDPTKPPLSREAHLLLGQLVRRADARRRVLAARDAVAAAAEHDVEVHAENARRRVVCGTAREERVGGGSPDGATSANSGAATSTRVDG